MHRVSRLLSAVLPRSGFGHDVSVIAGGTAANQLLNLAIAPVLARLYAPDDFGTLGAFMALLMMTQAIVGLRYELAIPLVSTDRDAALMLLVTLSAVVGLTLLVLVPLCVWLAPISAVLPQTLEAVLWLLPVGACLGGMYQSLRYWALRESAYREIASTTIAQGVGRGLTQTGLGWLHPAPFGLVIGEIAGRGAGILKLGRLAASQVKHHWADIQLGDLRAAAAAKVSFPLLLAPEALLNGAGNQLPTLLLASFFGAEVAGWYFMTRRLLGIPVQLISAAAGQVFLGEGAMLVEQDPNALKVLFDRVSRTLLLAGLLPTLGLMILGPWMTEVLLGPEWEASGIYLRWLAVSFLLKLSFDGLINLPMVRRNDYALAWAAFRLALTCGTILYAYHANMSGTSCVALLGIAFAVGYLCKLWLWNRAVRQLQEASA